MNMETPMMTASSYSSTAYNPMDMQAVGIGIAGMNQQLGPIVGGTLVTGVGGLPNYQAQQAQWQAPAAQPAPRKRHQKQEAPSMTRRIVQVFIVDTDENVPLKDCLIYRSPEPFLTDETDNELFHGIEIKRLLDAHNEKRTKLVNKAVKDRTEYLEPARIRDLRMNITTVAQF